METTTKTIREVILPHDRAAWLALRAKDVTSTESAALFPLAGGSPYVTAFELWHRKRDKVVVDIGSNERMEWGVDLQDSIARAFARRFGVIVEPFKEYMRIDALRMGSSFDWRIIGVDEEIVAADTRLQEMYMKHGAGIFEIKNVDRSVFRQLWVKTLSDDEKANGAKEIIEPPGHIDIQVQHQMHTSGYPWAAIGILVGGNTGKLLIRPYYEDVGLAIEGRIAEFWSAVDMGVEPQPNYPGDASFVASLYKTSTDKVFDGRGNEELDKIIGEYCAALEREKLAKEDKEVAKAKALRIIGDAERAYTDGATISAKEVGPAVVPSYSRSGYRGWKVTTKRKS
jgi:predicted phage-related endonuclease